MEVEIRRALEINFLFGSIVLKGGERRRFIIRGKAGFCEAVIKQFQSELAEQEGTVTIVSQT